ncbi:MAG: PT domain-containing protein [Lachnospiraceae bacterium]|nr:PT domain-containing protein [Lachnospiraceae bacterium]
MKKRIYALLLALCFSVCFVACDSASKTDSDEIESEKEDDEEDDEDEDDEDKDDKKDKGKKEEPTEEPTPEPTEEPTPEPTEEPTPEPTEEPEVEPTEEPDAEPTEEPDAEPTEEPDAEPTEEPDAEPTEEPDAEPTDKPEVQAPANLSDDLYDFQISIDGTVYQFPMWYEDFVALGWECTEDLSTKLTSNQYYPSAVFTKDGVKFYVGLANLSMNSVTLDKSMVYAIKLDDYYLKDNTWEFILAKGITRGVSTKDDIIAAYGEPSDEYDGSNYFKLTYDYDTYQEVVLYVSKETNTLNEIEIENMIELEGADNSVNPEVPDLVKNYVAPEALSENLYDFIINLEGNLYELPCPVSVFLENGFTINENKSEMEIGSGDSGWVEFKYNNMTYRTLVKNYADYATIAQNCFVTTFKTSEFDPKFDLTIPGNIKRGDSEADMLAIIEKFNFEKSESGDFIYYTVYDPDKSKLDSYEIIVTEGKVHSIEVENSPKMKDMNN